MNEFEKIEDFDNQSIQTIVFNMCKWFNFDLVTFFCEPRPAVASRVWINLKIEKAGKTWWIDGQRNDIVRKRLIEWLRSHLENERG